MTFQDQNGNTIVLERRIGGGGEAEIFSVKGKPHLVAKIYNAPSQERYAKLSTMVSHPPADPTLRAGHVSICWPTAVLFGSGGKAAGFLMPFMDRQTHREIFMIYHPSDRRTEAPNFTWHNLVAAAENVASVVASIHANGYVIGDINESNFFVSERTYVTLVDCDSMQVNAGSSILRCRVGKPEFTPPELQGKDFSRTDRTTAQDNFGLAVLTFLLLMEGVHPYFGVWQSPGDVSIEERIRRGACPYAGSREICRMPSSLPFDFLPQNLRVLFLRAFRDGHRNPALRPSPREWMGELRALGQSLQTCTLNKKHVYPSGLSRCIWCERAALLQGRDPFPLKAVTQQPVTQQPLPVRPFVNTQTQRPSTTARSGSVPGSPPTMNVVQQSGTQNAISRVFWKFVLVCFAVMILIVVAGMALTYLTRTDSRPSAAPVSQPAIPSPAPVAVEKQPSWPEDSVNVSVTSELPEIGARSEGVQFFQAGTTLPVPGSRFYTTVFEQTQDSFVYWQLNLASSAQQQRRSLLLTVYLYNSDNSLAAKSQPEGVIDEGSVNSSLVGYWTPQLSAWSRGDYRVSIFVDGTKVAAGTFSVQAPRDSQPPYTPVQPQTTDAPNPPNTNQPVTPPQKEQPQVQNQPLTPAPPRMARYPATHDEFGQGCQGILTLSDDSIQFECLSNRSPNQSFMFSRQEVKGTHKNGLELLTGKKYHFDIIGMNREQVKQLFAAWYTAH